MTEFEHIIVDNPADGVSRITLNRPDSRNALNNILRGEIYGTLERNDNDHDVRVTILRGAGKAFCAGYDLKANNRQNQPFHTSGGDGNWPRHVVDGFFRVWNLAKPVIAQVHGYCLATRYLKLISPRLLPSSAFLYSFSSPRASAPLVTVLPAK